jgi:hypothetical protein
MLSRVLVIIDGIRLVTGFIDHSQFVATTKYNTLADSHTRNHSTLNHLSVLSLVFAVYFLATDFSQFYRSFKYKCNYSTCTVFNSHTKSSWHSLIPSAADSLNSGLRLSHSLSLFWLNTLDLSIWYISSSVWTIHWKYSDFQMNSHLLFASHNMVSGLTSQRTPPLLRIRWNVLT